MCEVANTVKIFAKPGSEGIYPDSGWVECPGFPNYEIDEFGLVRNKKTKRTLRGGFLNSKVPYKCYTLRRNGKTHLKTAHRLTAEAFLGSPPSSKHQAAHRDSDHHNGHYTNLRWSTQAENEADKVLAGKDNAGDRNGQAKLTWDQVREIRRLREKGVACKTLAEVYYVTRHTIRNITSERTWHERPVRK
jgi:hypothetical protein